MEIDHIATINESYPIVQKEMITAFYNRDMNYCSLCVCVTVVWVT